MKTEALHKHLVFQGEKAYQRINSTGRARKIRALLHQELPTETQLLSLLWKVGSA